MRARETTDVEVIRLAAQAKSPLGTRHWAPDGRTEGPCSRER